MKRPFEFPGSDVKGADVSRRSRLGLAGSESNDDPVAVNNAW